MSEGQAKPPRFRSWLIVGIAATPFCLFLAVYSGRAGHGGYLFARLLYPLPMLLTRISLDSESPLSILLACVQFPLYGWLADRSRLGKHSFAVLLVILVVHVTAVVFCFAGALPNFS